MRVRAYQRIRVGVAHAVLFRLEHHASQILEIHLVNDAGVGRHHFEIVERRLTPAQESITLDIARELDFIVRCQRLRRAVLIDLDGVIDHKLGGRQRVHAFGIAAESRDRLAHRGEVHNTGHAREVLQDDARGREGDLVRRWRAWIPGEQRLDVTLFDVDAVFEAQQIFEQDFQRIRQACHLVLRERSEAHDLVSA